MADRMGKLEKRMLLAMYELTGGLPGVSVTTAAVEAHTVKLMAMTDEQFAAHRRQLVASKRARAN